MNEIPRFTLAVLGLLVSCDLAAQTFKCTNPDGKITYSGTKCSDLGLKEAGEVKDRVNVTPAYRPPPGAVESRPPPAPAAPAAKAPVQEAPVAAEEVANPERRCFTVKTPKGNVTRCNEKPD